MATKKSSNRKASTKATKIVNNINVTLPPKKNAMGLLPNPMSFQNAGKFRPRFYTLSGNETGIDKLSREQVVRLSRELFAQFPIFNVASDAKANLVVGDHWEFKYTGKDLKFKEAAESFINDTWYNRCNTRGSTYDFKTIIRLMSKTLDIDGDLAVIFTKDNEGWPLLQVVNTERITNNADGGDAVEVDGKSYSCYDGVLFDENMKPCYLSIGNTVGNFIAQGTVSNTTYVSLRNAKLIFSPQYFDKYRGLPALYAGVLYGLSLQELDQYLMETLKLESTIAVLNINDSGEAPQEYSNLLESIQAQAAAQVNGQSNIIGGIPGTVPSPTTHAINVQQGSTERYIKEGNDVKSFRSQRPSEEIQSYMNRIETALLSAIGYPHQLIYSSDKITGRSAYAITEMVRKNVVSRQQLLCKYAKLFVAWALSNAIELGYLPNTDENVYNCTEFTMPAQFSIDSGYDNKNMIENYKLGLTSLGSISESQGIDSERIMNERVKETNNLLNVVDQLSAQHKDMDKNVILNLITQRGNSSFTISSVPDGNNNE